MTYITKKEIFGLIEQLATQDREGFYASVIQDTLGLENTEIYLLLHELLDHKVLHHAFSVRGAEDVIYEKLIDIPSEIELNGKEKEVEATDVLVFYQFNPTFKEIIKTRSNA